MQSNGNLLIGILPFLFLFLIFYFLLIRPQKNRQKKHAQMILDLKKGDKIITTGGFIAEIHKIEDKFFAIKISDETIAKIAKESIAGKLNDEAK